LRILQTSGLVEIQEKYPATKKGLCKDMNAGVSPKKDLYTKSTRTIQAPGGFGDALLSTNLGHTSITSVGGLQAIRKSSPTKSTVYRSCAPRLQKRLALVARQCLQSLADAFTQCRAERRCATGSPSATPSAELKGDAPALPPLLGCWNRKTAQKCQRHAPMKIVQL